MSWPTLTRRQALQLLGSGAGTALVAACAPPRTTPAPAAPAPASSQPKAGGTLKTLQVGDPSSADGHVSSAFDSFWQVYDRLTYYPDSNLEPQPMLAESWDVSVDGKRIQLNLRKGVQFHSGREFTSDDVKYNLLRVRDPKVAASAIATLSKWFTDIQTPDKYTVVLGSDSPRPAAFDVFEYLNIVDNQTMEGPDAKTKAVGTGPFTFVEWQQGVLIRFAKNKSYWRSGTPLLDELVVNIAADPQSMVVQLESGAVDAADRVPLNSVSRLQQDPKYQAIVNQNGPLYLVGVNVTQPPLDNKLVRQALNFAIDRQRFTQTTLQGIVQSRQLPWPAQSPVFEASKDGTYTYDLDKAKALLAQAGVSNLKLDMIWVNTYADVRSFAEMYQADLAKIGVSGVLKPLEPPVWQQTSRGLQYGLNLTFTGPAALHPVSLASSAVFTPDQSTTGFKDERYSQLIAAVGAEEDAAKQKALYSQLNDFLLDQSVVMPLSANPTNIVVNARVHDVSYTMHEAVDFSRAWIA